MTEVERCVLMNQMVIMSVLLNMPNGNHDHALRNRQHATAKLLMPMEHDRSDASRIGGGG